MRWYWFIFIAVAFLWGTMKHDNEIAMLKLKMLDHGMTIEEINQ